MKKTVQILLVTLLSVTVAFAQKNKNKKKENCQAASCCQEKLLRHVVLFKFKDGTAEADIKKVEEAFRALPTKIKEIHGFEFGINNSPEGLDQGFTHCFFLSFKTEADRAVYLPHPDHKAFGQILGPHLDKVLVLDYWMQK